MHPVNNTLSVFFRVRFNARLLCRARAIEIRQQNQEAVGGFFSQIGSLYTVHHLWGEHKFTTTYRRYYNVNILLMFTDVFQIITQMCQ